MKRKLRWEQVEAIRKSEKTYDAYYCPKCLYWLEKICSSRECNFCFTRPKYPKVNQQ
jgi:hypothetical protein